MMPNTVEPAPIHPGTGKLQAPMWGLCLFCMVVAAWNAPVAKAQTPPVESRGKTDDSGLQEVVVTARRFKEDVNKVPESIVVLDAATLDERGARTAEDVLAISPGVDLRETFGIQT